MPSMTHKAGICHRKDRERWGSLLAALMTTSRRPREPWRPQSLARHQGLRLAGGRLREVGASAPGIPSTRGSRDRTGGMRTRKLPHDPGEVRAQYAHSLREGEPESSQGEEWGPVSVNTGSPTFARMIVRCGVAHETPRISISSTRCCLLSATP